MEQCGEYNSDHKGFNFERNRYVNSQDGVTQSGPQLYSRLSRICFANTFPFPPSRVNDSQVITLLSSNLPFK
ncbi:hypothetical protein ANTQUA_LOCUS109 [Anthophora quadrimaculata]